ncbi:hypothetical protein GC387_01250 [Pseudomonas sp. MWU12-2323]|nr:hypothetical protein [Pseudomonas sp. MWU12-2323]
MGAELAREEAGENAKSFAGKLRSHFRYVFRHQNIVVPSLCVLACRDAALRRWRFQGFGRAARQASAASTTPSN